MQLTDKQIQNFKDFYFKKIGIKLSNQEILEKWGKLINLMNDDTSSKPDEKNKAIINLKKVKDEIEEEGKPDIRNIKKWLEKAKSYIELAQFSKEIITLAKSVFISFGIIPPF